MRRLGVVLGWAFLGISLEAYAQIPSPTLSIPTFDRPGIADAPYTPARGSFQVELGTGLSGRIQSGRHQEAKLLKPAVLLRYAQAAGFEWRAQWNYAPPLGSLDDYLTRNQTQLLAMGAKVRCGKEQGWLPDWGLMGNLVIDPRYSSNQEQGKPLGGDLYLVTMHNLPNGLSINTNGGLGWFPSSSSLVPVGAVAVNWAPGGPWGFFGEVYAFGGRGQAVQKGWDTGLTYLLDRDKAQIDLSWMDSDLSQKGGGVLLVGFSRNFSKVP